VFQALPSAAFETPVRMAWPIPEGVDADQAGLYLLLDSGGGAVWHEAAHVRGRLEAPPRVEWIDGAPHLVAEVLHGGDTAVFERQQRASNEAGLVLGPTHWGNILLGILVMVALASARRGMRREG